MKILYWGDSPLAHTGYGVVARYILAGLYKAGHQIDVIGVNGAPGLPPKDMPYRIWAVPPGMAAQGVGAVDNTLLKREHDVLFVIGDPIMMQYLRAYKTGPLPKVVFYCPTDWYSGREASECLSMADWLVAPSEWSEKVLQRNLDQFATVAPPMRRIPHGVDHSIFYPAAESERAEWRKRYFGIDSISTFVFLSLAVNSPKKNLGCLVQAYRLLRSRLDLRRDNLTHSTVVMPCIEKDQGGDLALVIEGMDELVKGVHIDTMTPFKSQQDIAKMINASDALVLSTYSEGWGLPVTEAYACRTPVIAPSHTALRDDQHVLECGFSWEVDETELVFIPQYNGFRPFISAHSLAGAMQDLVQSTSGQRKEKLDKGQQVALSYTWENAQRGFADLFKEVDGVRVTKVIGKKLR